MANPRLQKSHFHMKLRSDGRGSDGDSRDNSDDETFQEAESTSKRNVYPILPKGDALSSDRLYPSLSKINRADEKDFPNRGVRSRVTEGSGDGLVFESRRNGDFDTRCQREARQAPSGLKGWHICGVCIFLLVGIFAFLAVSGSKAKAVPEQAQDPFPAFKSGIDTLSPRYPTQDPKTWKIIKAASIRVLRDPDPEDPMVLLLAAPKGSGSMATCLAREIAQAFSKARGVPLHKNFYQDGKLINSAGKDGDAEKVILDEGLKEVFENGGHAVVLDNVQALSGTAAQLLHPYCDNGNAIYKTVQFVFVAHLDDATNTAQDQVEAFLVKLWGKDINKEFARALMVRIANNLVPLVPESGFDPRQCQA